MVVPCRSKKFTQLFFLSYHHIQFNVFIVYYWQNSAITSIKTQLAHHPGGCEQIIEQHVQQAAQISTLRSFRFLQTTKQIKKRRTVWGAEGWEKMWKHSWKMWNKLFAVRQLPQLSAVSRTFSKTSFGFRLSRPLCERSSLQNYANHSKAQNFSIGAKESDDQLKQNRIAN